MGQQESPPCGTRLVLWLSIVSALQSTQGSGRSSSGSAQTTWDISELDVLTKSSPIWSRWKTQRVLSWRFAVTIVIVAITCFSDWNSMLMTPRMLNSNPSRANGSTLQRMEKKKKNSLVVERACLYRGERIGFGLGRCQFCLPHERSLRSPETQMQSVKQEG